MSKPATGLTAALHVGSEQVSIQIAEYQDLDNIKIIDTALRPVALGEETFKTGRISFSLVNEICEMLRGYRRMLAEYGVKDYRLLATTAIREAENQQYIIDQIKVKTGFIVEVADMPLEIFYKYAALLKLAEKHKLTAGSEGLLLVDISSGGLGITLFKEGEIKYQQTLHIGILRIKESFTKSQRDSLYFQQALNEYIFSVIRPVKYELSRYKINYLSLSSPETSLLLAMLGRDTGSKFTLVSVADFYRLYDRVKGLNLPQIMKTFNLSEAKADMVLPMIIVYKQILSLTEVGQIVVPAVHFIDGLILMHIAEQTGHPWLQTIDRQIVSSARSLGEKYRYNRLHAEKVEEIALHLFDRMPKVHGLGRRERLLLKVAAILHDIGKFVSLRRHYIHSYRLIRSSDILGFSEEEKNIMAHVALYHSRGITRGGVRVSGELPGDQLVIVAKLAAILSLADAMDRSHRQKIVWYEADLKGEELLVRVKSREDISLEEWTFADKARLFEEVFGIEPVLIRQVGEDNVFPS